MHIPYFLCISWLYTNDCFFAFLTFDRLTLQKTRKILLECRRSGFSNSFPPFLVGHNFGWICYQKDRSKITLSEVSSTDWGSSVRVPYFESPPGQNLSCLPEVQRTAACNTTDWKQIETTRSEIKITGIAHFPPTLTNVHSQLTACSAKHIAWRLCLSVWAL